MRLRILVSTTIGIASGMFCWFLLSHFHQGAADFSWAIRAAKYLLAGKNPYDTPLEQYPMTAALFGLPFVWMRPEVAAGAFYGVSSALLAFGLTRYGYHRLLVFLAYPYWAGILTAQWSPLIVASAFFPLLLPVTMVKPQIGLPVALTHLTRRGVIACAVVVVLSLLVMPRWPFLWAGQLGYYEHFIPLLVLPGPLLLLALWRYRDRDAIFLLLAAIMPQRWFFDAFILWLIPKSRREILATVFFSYGAGIWRWYHTPHSFTEVGRWTVLFIYLPMLGVVLARSVVRPWSYFRNAVEQRQHLYLFMAALSAFSMWFFVDRIWAPPPETHFSDLYPRWYGSRELLLHGRDPYSPAVTREIQIWGYGHALDSGRYSETRDENRFAYPLYVAFVLAPTVALSFPTVQNLFRVLLPALLFAGVSCWLAMLRWRPSKSTIGAIALLSFGSFPALESVYLQQPVLLAGAFLAACGAALSAHRLELAGALLALATIKPQLSFLIVAWLLTWAFCGWRSRKRLVLSFGITMLALVGFSELLVPGWIPEFVAGLTAYQYYTGNFSILSVYFKNYGAAIANLSLLAAFALVIWRTRHEPEGTDLFTLTFCLALTVTLVIIPTVYPTGQVLLLPAIFLVLKNSNMLWKMGRAARLSCVALWCLIGWQWLGSFTFMLASSAVPLASLKRFWIVPLATILLIPLAVLILLAILTRAALKAGGLNAAADRSR